MKRYLLLLLIPVLLVAGPACRKNKKDLTAAIITGVDGRYCACCGGYMITFTDNPQPYAPPFKLISNNISSEIGNNPTFPIYVDVAWSNDASKCSDQFVIISKLIKK